MSDGHFIRDLHYLKARKVFGELKLDRSPKGVPKGLKPCYAFGFAMASKFRMTWMEEEDMKWIEMTEECCLEMDDMSEIIHN